MPHAQDNFVSVFDAVADELQSPTKDDIGTRNSGSGNLFVSGSNEPGKCSTSNRNKIGLKTYSLEFIV